MSVSAPSDIPQSDGGFDGAATPSIPDYRSGEFPMDGADVATEAPDYTSEPASEGAVGPGFTEDDVNFLQSDDVRTWLQENTPTGFLTEKQHEERLKTFQTTKDQEVSRTRQQLQQVQGEVQERQAQLATLVSALRSAWAEAGHEPGSQEYQQREAALLQQVQSQSNAAKVQQQQQGQQLAQFIAQHAATTNQLLNVAGLTPVGNPDLQNMIRGHIDNIRNGAYSTPDQIDSARARMIAEAKQKFAQAPVQQQPPASTPPTQTQQRPRPNFGPGPGPRGGGGGVPVSYEDAYEQGRQQLITQYGGWPKVPQSELENLDMHAQLRSLGVIS